LITTSQLMSRALPQASRCRALLVISSQTQARC
jgi:hypothetical protein